MPFNESISPYVFSCLNKENKVKFSNFSKENIFDFLKFFSNTSYSFNESKYISVDFKWDLMCQFIDLNELILIVEKNLKNENIYAKEKDLYEHFLEYCLYLNGEDAGN